MSSSFPAATRSTHERDSRILPPPPQSRHATCCIPELRPRSMRVDDASHSMTAAIQSVEEYRSTINPLLQSL